MNEKHDPEKRQRRLALVMGTACLVAALFSAVLCLVDQEFGSAIEITILLVCVGLSLLAYWWSGKDPKGWGKPITGKKDPTKPDE